MSRVDALVILIGLLLIVALVLGFRACTSAPAWPVTATTYPATAPSVLPEPRFRHGHRRSFRPKRAPTPLH